jgi:predicted PurR-regulated permease PerM
MTLMTEVRQKLYWWLLGRLVSMTVVGIATGLGLWLLGMPMALSLALLAALLVFIPNLGPILAAIPALLVALSEGMFWPVLALYLLIQAVESNVITPLVDRQSVKLPPALLLSAQITMGLIAGVLGLILAAPLTVLATVLIKRLYVDRRVEPIPADQQTTE